MNDEERITAALEYGRQARSHLILATEAADPVERRNQLARAAARHRLAADLLDDHGRITEGY